MANRVTCHPPRPLGSSYQHGNHFKHFSIGDFLLGRHCRREQTGIVILAAAIRSSPEPSGAFSGER